MPAGNFLQIGFANGGVTALALGGMYNVAETLTLVGPDSVAGMPVMSLPYSLKYVADAADGRSFVLVDDGVIDDQLAGVGEVVFFGTPGAMREQSATDDSIGDSSGTHMEYGFTMDGVAYKMSWEPRVTDGSGAVKMGDATLSSASAPGVTFKARNPLPQPLAGFTFICTRPTAN
jgi:hypothetical protein